MTVTLNSSTFTGIDGIIVTVEVDISRGMPAFNIVGLPDTSVKESKERVRAAIVNSGFEFPLGRITVNLAPADIKKEGALFDLPIALGILSASEQISLEDIDRFIIIGELSLNGSINEVKGVLPIVLQGYSNSFKNFILPAANINECSSVSGIRIFPFSNLNEVTEFLIYKNSTPYKFVKKRTKIEKSNLDFSDVIGQESTKRALEISCAGGHNIIIFGPPGCGKSMLAQRIPSIMPDLSDGESLEISKIYSIVGKLDSERGLIQERPFRSPHHTVSMAALTGGGVKLLPGEISLAHNGILFLDELLEFKKDVLEVLREPMEEKYITISRSTGTVRYPANFMFIGALNPCSCGFYLSGIKECTCSEFERLRYLKKLSGPFLNRIDIFSFAHPQSYDIIEAKRNKGETSAIIKKRVQKARELQYSRFAKDNIYCNGDMNDAMVHKYCYIDKNSKKLLKTFFNKYPFSVRLYNRILKVARTIADLEGSDSILYSHIVEAINYRKFIDDKII